MTGQDSEQKRPRLTPSAARAQRQARGSSLGRHLAESLAQIPIGLRRLGLVVLFVGVSVAMFSQQKPNSAVEEPLADDTLPESTPHPPLTLTEHFVGSWGYVLNDSETLRREEAESNIKAGDDPISRAMLAALENKQNDRLEVSPEGLHLVRSGASQHWTWTVSAEQESALVLALSGAAKEESAATATFEGHDWLELQLGLGDTALTSRWRRLRSNPAAPSPSESEAVQPPQEETP